MKSLLALFVLALHKNVVFGSTDAADWDYSVSYGRLTPDQWSEHYPACAGKRQSPVDVVDASLVADKSLKPLTFINYDKKLTDLKMRNDGHTIKIEVPKEINARVQSPSLPASYRLTQFHFHWPSEHSINGKEFPLELHLVHVNEAVPDTDTLKNSSGLLVVAIMFTEGVSTRSFRILSQHLTDTYLEGKESVLSEGVKLSEFLPSDTNSYVRYSGSLTTPPCAEVAEFHILTRTTKATKAEIWQFGNLYHTIKKARNTAWETIKSNDRPMQPLNGRQLRLHGNMGDLPTNKKF